MKPSILDRICCDLSHGLPEFLNLCPGDVREAFEVADRLEPVAVVQEGPDAAHGRPIAVRHAQVPKGPCQK